MLEVLDTRSVLFCGSEIQSTRVFRRSGEELLAGRVVKCP